MDKKMQPGNGNGGSIFSKIQKEVSGLSAGSIFTYPEAEQLAKLRKAAVEQKDVNAFTQLYRYHKLLRVPTNPAERDVMNTVHGYFFEAYKHFSDEPAAEKEA